MNSNTNQQMKQEDKSEKKRYALVLSILASVVCVGTAIFQWSIIDWISPFLFIPLEIILLVLFLGSVVASAISGFSSFKSRRMFGLLPLGVNGLTAMAILFAPFTDLWLQFNYRFYLEERKEVVDAVQSGELLPTESHRYSFIKLPEGYPDVSIGGSIVIVEPLNDAYYLFFYTFRGILDSYAGFLYTPDGGTPEDFARKVDGSNFIHIEQYGQDWYFVSAH